MACFMAILLLGFICSFQVASGSLASKLSKAALVPSTATGTYSRSSTVAALSLLEQGKLEEATESLVQTALTLSLLDVGGGAISPITEEIVKYITTKSEFTTTREAVAYYNRILKSEISKTATQGMNKQTIRNAKEALKNNLKNDVAKFALVSKVQKAFTKATKWFGKASLVDVFGPLTDTVTIGLNIWGLDIAIRDGNKAGIAEASLSIAAGVIGLSTFFAAVSGGPVGAIAGAILRVVATLVELFAGPPYDKAAVEAYRARLRELRNLRDACVSQIDKRMEFLENVGSPFSDVYVNNQASSMTNVELGELQLVDSYMIQSYRQEVPYQNSMYHRGFMGNFTRYMSSEAKEEMRNGSYVCIGKYRGIVSPYIPPASSSTDWSKTTGFTGFDFYGKYRKNTTYGGVHVFINSEFISQEELNGINIDTFLNLESDADQEQTPQNDVISISDYKKLRKDNKINIRTGFGSDCLNINGMIGELHQDNENSLSCDMVGHGWNILSFKGMSRDRDDIKGVFFDTKHEVLKYFHGDNRKTHTLGKVFFVTQFIGSPFDDHVILHKELFKVFQTSGSNVYEFDFDEFDLGEPTSKIFEITDQSKRSLKINLKTSDATKILPSNIVLSYKKLKIFSTRGQYTDIPRIELSLWNTTTNGNIFINNDNPIPLDHGHLNPWRLKGERRNLNIGQSSRTVVNYDDGNREDLLLLKWPTDQDPDSTDYTIDMKGGTDYVMISDKYLLGPSGVDGEDVTLMLEQGSDFDSTGAFTVVIQKSGGDEFHINLELRNVERIVNEYGNRLVAFDEGSHQFPMDLFDRYMEVTRSTLKIKTTEDVLD